MVALRTTQERVRKSALLLDKEVPHWERKVSIYELDMNHSTSCIVGQLNLDICDMDEERGFSVLGSDDATHADLTRMWKHQILKRRKADANRRKAAPAKKKRKRRVVVNRLPCFPNYKD